MSSVVYFIAGDGHIKIGFSRNLAGRLHALQTSTPTPLEVVATIPGGLRLETAIHLELKAYRRRGEWFEDCQAVRSATAELCSSPPPVEDDQPSQANSTVPVVADGDLLDLLEDVQRRFGRLIGVAKVRRDAPAIRVVAEAHRRLDAVIGDISPEDDDLLDSARFTVAFDCTHRAEIALGPPIGASR